MLARDPQPAQSHKHTDGCGEKAAHQAAAVGIADDHRHHPPIRAGEEDAGGEERDAECCGERHLHMGREGAEQLRAVGEADQREHRDDGCGQREQLRGSAAPLRLGIEARECRTEQHETDRGVDRHPPRMGYRRLRDGVGKKHPVNPRFQAGRVFAERHQTHCGYSPPARFRHAVSALFDLLQPQ